MSLFNNPWGDEKYQGGEPPRPDDQPSDVIISADRAGYWEDGGYHMLGDPWREQRFRGD